MRYVIVGNSAAAVGAIESIRKIDGTGDITVIGDEPYHVYSRPLIAHYVAGEVGDGDLNYRPADFYESHGVEARLGTRAEGVDFLRQEVVLAGGEAVPFDRLLLATGSRVTFPRLTGAGLAGVVEFQRLDDARFLKDRVRGGGRAVVIGAGLIGLRAAYGLRHAGAEVVVVELLPRVLARVLDERASRLVEELLAREDIRILTGSSVTEIIGHGGRVSGVVLNDGRQLSCDVVVKATGVAPETGLAANGGPRVGTGIRVNEYFQTSFSAVYAAGDVAETHDIPRGRPFVNANWPNAHEQGRIAGLNMAGERVRYRGSVGMNSVSCHGVPVMSLGLFDPGPGDGTGYEVKTRFNPAVSLYQKLVFQENRLKGAILMGDLGYSGAILHLIREQTLAGVIKDAILEEKYQFFNFLRKQRQEKLEGKNIRWKESYSSPERYEKRFNEETWTQRERDERPWG